MRYLALACRCIVSCGLLGWGFLSVQESHALDTLVVGGAERPWIEGGGDENTSPPGLTPLFRLTPRTVSSGNAPGKVIDFTTDPGWIAPTQIEPEDNIFQLIREQGGTYSISSPNNSDLSRDESRRVLFGVTDGSATVYLRKPTPSQPNVNPTGEHIDIDLGAPYGLERIVFYPSSFYLSDFLRAFEIKVNDGTILTDSGNPDWRATPLVFREGQNTRSRTDVRIPLQFVRYMRLTSRTSIGFEIDEIELHGRGYVPTSRFISDVFDLGEKGALWGRIHWSAEVVGNPGRSTMSVRTRSGSTPLNVVFTRRVSQKALGQEPFLVEMDGISYDRALVGLVRGPVEVPEQILEPADYGLLSEEVRQWLNRQGATYTVLDEEENEQAATRAEYDATATARQGRVSLTAFQIDPDIYQILARPVRDWLQVSGARYFRRANIAENVPYGIDGQLLNATTYNRLPEVERGPMLDDTERWSPWSAPYVSGDGITSPSPRRFFQFEIRFASTGLDAARRVDSISFEVSFPPVAQLLVAEIFPRQVQPGRSVEFVYAVRASLDPSDPGFDNFDIRTSAPIERLEEIQIIDARGAVRAQQVFGVDVDGLATPYEGGEFALVSVQPNRFRVRFPRIDADGTVLKLRFATSVLRYGLAFDGWGLEEGSGELPQPAIPGNVMQLAPGDADNRSNLRVLVDLKGDLLRAVRAVPNPFTPNGDGVNDVAEIRYDLFKLTEATPVEVVVYDLSGRRIRVLFAGEIAGGRYAVAWDGTDAGDRLVPPGLYLFEIRVSADTKPEEALGTVAVVY